MHRLVWILRAPHVIQLFLFGVKQNTPLLTNERPFSPVFRALVEVSPLFICINYWTCEYNLHRLVVVIVGSLWYLIQPVQRNSYTALLLQFSLFSVMVRNGKNVFFFARIQTLNMSKLYEQRRTCLRENSRAKISEWTKSRRFCKKYGEFGGRIAPKWRNVAVSLYVL